jgi:ATP-dependent Clp protease ATP-binding subunit ClpA
LQIRIPLYFESRQGGPHTGTRYTVRPLFFHQPERTDDTLSRAVAKLTQDLARELAAEGCSPRHESLARYSYYPDLEEHRLNLRLELRRRAISGRFYCVSLRALGRKLAFFPAAPEVWFEYRPGDRFEHRAAAALTAHFRKLEKAAGAEFEFPTYALLDGTAWISPVEISVSLKQKLKRPEFDLRALLGGGGTSDGNTELHRVGRCLNWLYPGELDRVIFRDREVGELTQLLNAPDRRPILLVGPRLVGKTALVHEYVYRETAQRRITYANRSNVWLLSPQRLVSGMSYVGQWEDRLLAILKTAGRRDHVLYFDDLLGLYRAGISSASSLSMAHVLRPYIERRSGRFVAEMTPEALRVFREQDRGLADQFHVIPVREPPPHETLRILLHHVRQLERQHKCQFELDALPAVVDLSRQYVRDGVFPGKGARFLQQLAVRSPGKPISRTLTLEEFRARSGLRLDFVDPNCKLDRATVLAALRARIIGQSPALEAVADVITIARARLNDPGRPLAALLFLGPTGVGKTECAKATAAFLFGDAARLLRFDMNEYVTPGSAARLVGTFQQPEGLLTSAVQRQPFSVILLDEIEKASSDVHDLLLQVLGEGRLTDAMGRTADFSNAIVVLTSNLGVVEASGSVGFQELASEQGHAYVKAAERFFRPEFFNRLDRIIPFENLGRAEISRIARLVISDVLSREGLARRKCYLRIDAETLDAVAGAAFSTRYGARALKRGIERQLTRPVAEKLAQLGPQTLTVLSLAAGAAGLEVDLAPLVDADPYPTSLAILNVRDLDAVYQRSCDALTRIEAQAAAWRPAGAFTATDLSGPHYRYFLVREIVEEIREAAKRFDDLRAARHQTMRYTGQLPNVRHGPSDYDWPPRGRLLHDAAAAYDMHEFIRDLGARPGTAAGSADAQLAELLRQIACLNAVVSSAAAGTSEQVLLLIVVPEAAAGDHAMKLHASYLQLFEALSLETQVMPGPLPAGMLALVVRGGHAAPLASSEEGTHLVLPRQGHFLPLQVIAREVPDDGNPHQIVHDIAARRHARTRGVQPGGSLPADPLPWQPVIRIYEETGRVVDVRTGTIEAGPLTTAAFRNLLLGSLPLPVELWKE